ncbi:ParB/RepB/Spo0J family partition protein [Catellatospora sp. NPDC049133]|uniref:ParB/RepB/Spo0J family partition protein n=1 Tax=Catellatospora sp. NPDC049133 TaxID=3155499 RepID=UPI0033F6F640
MARQAGLSKTTTDDLAERRRKREHRELIEGAVSHDEGSKTLVDLKEIANHPHEPMERLDDVTDLVATIKSAGQILSPPVVVTRAAFLAAWTDPQSAEAIRDAKYVLLFGHRRCEAARQLGWEQVEVRIADDLVDATGRDLEIQFIENFSRQQLNPIEEARGLAAIKNRGGVSEHDMADRLGISQGQINKRLQLLRLSEELQLAVIGGKLAMYDDGPMPVSQALVYANRKVSTEDQARAWEIAKERGLRAEAAFAALRVEQEKAEGLADAQRRATAEGIEYVDAGAMWGERAADHLLRDEGDIQAAREAGTLRVTTDARGGIVYATTTPPEVTAGAVAPRQRVADDERRMATQARKAACRRIAGRKPATADAARRLALIVTDRTSAYGEALKLAHGWLQASDVGPDASDAYEFRDKIRASGNDQLVVHLACVMALAYDEIRARDPEREWDTADAAHIDRLVAEASYEPTAWELGQLDRARTNNSAPVGAESGTD